MLSAKLEELIWDGRAEMKTWCIGSGAAGLNVKNNQTVIILAVDFFGFLDSGEGTIATDPELWRAKMNKQITFYNKKSRHTLLARSFYSEFQGLLSSHHRFEMYWPFTENIVCNIGNFEEVQNWTFVNGPAPIESGQLPPPLGYGNANGPFGTPQVQLEIEFNTAQSDDEAVPFPDTRPGKKVNFHNFETAFSTDSQVVTPSQDALNVGELQYPMLTVHYLVTNLRLKAKFA